MEKLIDRESELETLQSEYARNGSALVVLYGRRRVGKTTLISEFIKDKNALFFLASEESETQNRHAFKENAAEFMNSDLLRNADVHADEPLVADKYDREFHLLLLEGCGNRVLQVFSGVLVTYFEKTSHRIANMDKQFFLDIARQEREILKAIRMGDAQKASELLRTHLMEQSQLLPL